MTVRLRMAGLGSLLPGVRRPAYAPERVGRGIVHLGPGAFHRAHQAVYTDDALAEGGNWRITGVSLRGTGTADAINAQDGLYTLLVRTPDHTQARVVASMVGVIAARREPGAALAALEAPETRIVSLTVTEKAYGIDRATRRVLPDHPAIAPDLAAPRQPGGAIGVVIEALRRRRQAVVPPFTVLCCDNLPENGALLRAGVLDFSGRIDAGLRDWIADAVAFPSTMVDRITPAATEATLADAERLTGFEDRAAIETEPFTQWVIEDRFTAGRPIWEAGGALVVADVAPYEKMKLRMLNGSHSMLAYAGFLAGHRYVRDVMADRDLARLVGRHLAAAAATLEPLPGIDFADYARELVARFANPAIAHETYQIAMDGTEKLPQRLLEPAVDALDGGAHTRPFAFAVAAWMRYALGRTDAGDPYPLRDPREPAIAQAVAAVGRNPQALVAALQALPGVFPDRLRQSARWTGQVADALGTMLERGMPAAIAAESMERGQSA
jgi:fructuronate reductase